MSITSTSRVVGVLVAMDMVFKLLVTPAYLNLVPEAGIGLVAAVLAPFAVAWVIAMIALMAPVRAYRAAVEPRAAITGRAAARLRRLPMLFALLWSATWCVPFAIITLVAGAWSFGTALFVGAMLAGPLPLAFILTDRLVSSTAQAVSLHSRRQGFELHPSTVTLRARMVGFCLAIGVAPSLYIASIAVTARGRDLPFDNLALAIVLFLAGVVVFAVLCAVLFADAIARPVAQMVDVAASIAHQGDVSRVGRLPFEHADELGRLAMWTNRMLDRLEQIEAERAAAHAQLAQMNHTLEQRVEDRTANLEQAHAALAGEMKTRLAVEVSLRQAQKLEAVGRLAAGVAHEINTPVQFVNDSTMFLQSAMTELAAVIARYRELRGAAADCAACRAATTAVAEAEEAADVDYLVREIPGALARALDGLKRVATIVRSMKQFAHPDQSEMSAVDLNQAIASTLTIARTEYKYVADVETDLAELPLVTCYGGEVNQVVLNLLVNAAHAIGDVVRDTDRRGTITLRTRATPEAVTISISDTGGGIPVEIRELIFDPFFTTKDVGRGTGQGLAIAKSVVDKHGGQIAFETELGVGTTFHIRLPIEPARPRPVAADQYA